MKTAKPGHSDVSSSRRAQPVRQTRNNPPRSSLLGRSYSSRDAPGSGLGGGHNPERSTKIYPAITYFADAITALPKELMRHFTLLKEVDAKIFTPEEALGQLVEAALNSPRPPPRPQPETSQYGGPTSAPESAPMSANGSVISAANNSFISVHDAAEANDLSSAAWDPANVPRRQLFRQCAITMQEMLVSLDEKNHVISTATEALNKQLSRLGDCFPYIEQEISEEARYGSDKHWAYTDTRISKPAEKPRRDAGNHLSNGHALSVDEAAARSDARKQALLAKKGRMQPAESDFDDHIDSRHRADISKKPHGNSKKGRPLDLSANASLGSINSTSINGNPPTKRRKVEKGISNSLIMERSMSGVFGTNGVASKGKMSSPSETPQPETAKRKSKTASAINGNTRKKTTATTSNAMSPSLASSPIHNTFAESKTLSRTSPVPANGSRPVTSRGRQNSTQSAIDAARSRPSPSAGNKPNGNAIGQADLAVVANVTGRSVSDVKASMKESGVNSKGEHMIEDRDEAEPEMRGGLVVGTRKEAALKREDTDANSNTAPMHPTIVTTITTTKSGRASKPSTPALASFPEPVRSRSGRNTIDQLTTNKRSHKKGAGQAALQAAAAAQNVDDEATSKGQSDEEEVEIDPSEPTYCYCNGVSYGEMVACDADGCAKEWFHLDCVGLKVAPKGNAKWYCDDCKEIMKNSKRFNGR